MNNTHTDLDEIPKSESEEFFTPNMLHSLQHQCL